MTRMCICDRCGKTIDGEPVYFLHELRMKEEDE